MSNRNLLQRILTDEYLRMQGICADPRDMDLRDCLETGMANIEAAIRVTGCTASIRIIEESEALEPQEKSAA